jgi:DNA polymerase-1
LINEFGSLEQLYARLSELSRKPLREKLAAHHDEAMLSQRLIRLQEELDVPRDLQAYRLGEPDRAVLRELYTELEFTRLLEGVIEMEAVNSDAFVLIRDQDTLFKVTALLAKAPFLVIDTETTSLDPLVAELVGISVCGGPEGAWYLSLAHRNGQGDLLPGQLDREVVLATLRPLLEDGGLPKLGHNLKFDYSVLAACCDLRMAGPLWDTMIAAYLLDPARRSYKLDDLCKVHLGLQLTSFEAVTEGDKRPEAFAYVAPEAARNYSCEDVIGAVKLWELYRVDLVERDQWRLFSELESGLVPILAEMELAGIRLDPEQLRILSEEFALALANLEKEIYRLAGQEFNINSPRQLGEILFDKLKLPHGRKTKTGYSTDINVLEKLAYHELPREIISHRNLAKLKTTYTDKLASLIHPATGRVHTSFNQTVTSTGRLSSSNPNLQNIPIRTPEGQRIRQAFIPAPGHLFLAGDYSQIDLRVLAHYCRDEALLSAFRSGQDIHNRTAAEIFMVSPLLVTSQMRRVAKTINFGIVYGMSSFGLAGQLNLSRRQAQDFIDRYFALYTGVKRFMADIVTQARQDGYVTTLFQRRRVLPEINSSNKTRREFAERTAINTPIQGTAADIIKLAMLRVHERLGKEGLQSRMLLQIHDELVFEVPEAELEKMQLLVRETMEGVAALDVPLVVNLASGHNLAEV